MHRKYPLPSYASLLFFPFGFILSLLWKTIGLGKVVAAITILSSLGWIAYTRYYSSSYFWYLLLTINFVSSVYLLGVHVRYKQEFDQHFGRLNNKTIRWIYVPAATVCSFFAILVICASLNGVSNFSFSAYIEYLATDKELLVLFLMWSIFVIYSYITPQ